MSHAEAWNWNDLPPRAGFVGTHDGRQIPTRGVTVKRWRITEPAQSPEHSHPYDQWVFVQDGRMTVTCEGVEHRLREGSVLRIPANTVHAAAWETACDLLEIGMGEDLA